MNLFDGRLSFSCRWCNQVYYKNKTHLISIYTISKSCFWLADATSPWRATRRDVPRRGRESNFPFLFNLYSPWVAYHRLFYLFFFFVSPHCHEEKKYRVTLISRCLWPRKRWVYIYPFFCIHLVARQLLRELTVFLMYILSVNCNTNKK